MTLTSVITPAYKAEPFIVSAVRSMLAQEDPSWEMLIVSDDGQDYRSLLAENNLTDPRLKFFTTGTVQGGPALARNVALAQAKGEVVVLLDADDTLSPDYLVNMAPAALKHGMAQSCLMQRYIAGDGDSRDSAAPSAMQPGHNPPSRLLNYNTQVNLAARRDLIAFPWREDIHFAEDILFSLQLADRVSSVYYEPQAVYYYHVRAGSATNGQHHSSSMLTCKQYVRSLVIKGEILLRNDQLKKDFLDYYHRSIMLEEEYVKAAETHQSMTFGDFVTHYNERRKA